ncbi:peptide chain release factor N(5)-glutamine methyltransferase [Synergistaceae bacterium OttesenSCG-928-I11]|nr:peptide chain release factor N(5)-glutamine methyltransferase [Synergistaceae bacterium OttesenSCG-928-I11]
MQTYGGDPIPKTATAGHLRLVVGTLFSDCGVPDSMLEADRVLGHVLGVTRASLHAHPERTVGEKNFARIIELSIRRAAGEPSAYLIGSSFFCGRSFAVDRRVLIPRPETEVLASVADRFIKLVGAQGVFADWCTGSGCIAVTLLADNPGWRAYAVDASGDALAVARENAARYGVSDRLTLIECADPIEARKIIPVRSLDLLVSNPPYIPSHELATLETQVRDFEPALALDGGQDGADILRALLEALPGFMKPTAPMFFETAGEGQIEAVRHFSRDAVLEKTFADHRDISRFALFAAR